MSKQNLLNIFGNKCLLCGYDGIALHFHHVDSKDKSFNISEKSSQSLNKNYELLLEMTKVVCLCANCHFEIHNDSAKMDVLNTIAVTLEFEDLLD